LFLTETSSRILTLKASKKTTGYLQHMPHLRMRDQVLKEVERRCFQPLQIVKKDGERVLFPCEYAEKPPKTN
jgi:hypothetical protein